MNNTLKLFSSNLLVTMLCCNSYSVNAMDSRQDGSNIVKNDNINNQLNAALFNLAREWIYNGPTVQHRNNDEYTTMQEAMNDLLKPYSGITLFEQYNNAASYVVNYCETEESMQTLAEKLDDVLLKMKKARSSFAYTKDYEKFTNELQNILKLLQSYM